MPIQFELVVRPLAYLLAIILFWHTVKHRRSHWRFVGIMCGLFVVLTIMAVNDSGDQEDKVLTFLGFAVPYRIARVALENVGLFAIIGSLVILLTKRLETAHEEVAHLARVASSSADAIIAFDVTGTVTGWNRGAELVFGYLADEMIGQKLDRLTGGEGAEALEAAVQRCNSEGFVRGLSTQMVGKGGRAALVEATLSSIRDEEGNAVGTSLFVRDTTEQKEMETELMQASKMTAMGTMASGVVQEFGNLLTVISSRAQMGLSAASIEEAREEFDAISSCTARARSITNNLLSYAQRQQPRKIVGKLSEAIEAALVLLERELERAKISVRRRYDPVPDTAFDRDQLVQVFVNLFINAVNAMRESGGAIEVGVARKQDYIDVSIRDNGPDISQEAMSRLFEPFTSTGGLPDVARAGLSLFVCRQIVKYHNGNMTVESRKNEGTTFHVYLPLTAGPEVVREVTETRIIDRGECTVAVVDADTMIRELLAQALKRRGVAVETFRDADSARAAGIGDKYNVAFVDASIRDGGGRRFVQELKSAPRLMLIGMTSEAAGDEETSRIEDGLFQMLRKPFGLDDINAICDIIKPESREDAHFTSAQSRAKSLS